MRLCIKKATKELTQSIPQKNKQNPASLQLHAAEKHKPTFCVRGIFSAGEGSAHCG